MSPRTKAAVRGEREKWENLKKTQSKKESQERKKKNKKKKKSLK